MCRSSLLGTSEAASKLKKMPLQDSVTVRSTARKSRGGDGHWQTPVWGGGDAQLEL